MAVRAYFSGVEGDQHFNACVRAGVRHVLSSFLYMEKKSDPNIVARRKQANPKMGFFVDSGAHTFQTEAAKYRSWSLTDYEDYLRRYVKWIKQNRKYIDAAAELDIDYVVGLGVVEKWRKEVFRPLEEEYGIPIVYVWHKSMRIEGWEELCHKQAYVGLPGEMSSEPDFNKYMTIARRYTAKVHGFAATKQLDFRDVPWFSIDSITWKTCEMYGTLIDWDSHKQKLKFEQDKGKRAKYRAKFNRLGFNAEAIIADTDYKELTRYALFSMRQMEAFYERRYKDRVFFYELRLPFPRIIRRWKPKKIWRIWRKMSPEKNFDSHKNLKNIESIRTILIAISAVQNQVLDILENNKEVREFLRAYFINMMEPSIVDLQIFQKEVAKRIAPPNPPPLPRVEASHFFATENVPEPRQVPDFRLSELEFDPLDAPIPLAEIA